MNARIMTIDSVRLRFRVFCGKPKSLNPKGPQTLALYLHVVLSVMTDYSYSMYVCSFSLIDELRDTHVLAAAAQRCVCPSRSLHVLPGLEERDAQHL